jgi:transcriptional regulator with XRE-family HTH domain
MTTLTFKIWLVTNGYTQLSLAKQLNMTDRTISNYCSAGRFPLVFELALQSLTK